MFIAGSQEHALAKAISVLDPRPLKHKRVTLHEEMADILRPLEIGWMSTPQLADEVNRRGRYRKKDGSSVTALQIIGRAHKYPDVFERSGTRVRVRPK